MHEGPANNPEREVSNKEAIAEYLTMEVLRDVSSLENEYRASSAVDPYYAIAKALRRLAQERQGHTDARYGGVGTILYCVYLQLADLYEQVGADETRTVDAGLQEIADTFSLPDVQVMVYRKLLGNRLGERLR